jgi:pseudouridine synthase
MKTEEKTKSMRLQKYLAHQGIDSRRRCEEYIRQGLVKVNGQIVTQLGTKIDPEKDRVEVSEKTIQKTKEQYRTILLYKPRGYVCTTAEGEGKTIYTLISDIGQKLVPIGRLDKKSEGLLLMSNDGELVHRLTHPSFGHSKTYHVMVSGPFTDKTLQALNRPMQIDGYKIQPAKVCVLRPGKKTGRIFLEFVLKEGRKHQIRKMCEQNHLEVHRLIRVQSGHLTLAGVRPGTWRELSAKEVRSLGTPTKEMGKLL